MERGDISNMPTVRLVWVFETTIGFFANEKDLKKHDRAVRLKRYESAASTFSLDPTATNAFYDYVYRKNFSCDFVTYLHPAEAPFIEAILDDLGYPYGTFTAMTLHDMTRGLTNSPSVAAVFDGDPSRRFAYGGKTRSTLVL